MEHIQEREPPAVITSDTNNATKIHPSDAPDHKAWKYKKFRAYNTGMWNGAERENTEQFRRQDNLHRYDSLASSLELTDYQKARGRHHLDEINVRAVGSGVDAVIFAICVLVVNSQVPDGSRYYPNPNCPDDRRFIKVAESLGLDRGEQVSVIEKVRSRLNF